MVEEWNISWWNSRTSHKGTVEHVMLEQWNRDGGTVQQRWWNSGPADGGTVEQSWWNSGISDVGTVEHLTVEQ